MNDLLRAVILGVVEGVTEFIPVSSTGHLILAGHWLDFTGERAKTFEVFIQLGAILAVAWVYRARFLRVVRGLPGEPTSRRFVINLAVAFLPAAIMGFLARDVIKEHLFRPTVVAWALVAGGVAMLVIEWKRPAVTVPEVDAVPARTALGIGIAQILSLVPGVSRSGATIMGGYLLGLSRPAAAEFSFFLAVPMMVAATGYDLWKSREVLSAADAPVFALGFVVAYVSALIVLRAFIAFISRHSFTAFAWYRIGFGLALLVLLARG